MEVLYFTTYNGVCELALKDKNNKEAFETVHSENREEGEPVTTLMFSKMRLVWFEILSGTPP